MTQNIIFFGDSYCASFHYVGQGNRKIPGTNQDVDAPGGHPSLVAQDLGYNLYNFGYGGKGWWYSRDMMYTYLANTPEVLENTAAMVFFHTDPYRLLLSRSHEPHDLDYHDKVWQTGMIDHNYLCWSQSQWFLEINQRFGTVPTVHFFCYHEPTTYSQLLPGMSFISPLIHLSIGEMLGTDKQILSQIYNDKRANHFNTHNNRAIADIIVQALANYQPGTYTIDSTKFDQPNKNAHRWPEPGHGTQ